MDTSVKKVKDGVYAALGTIDMHNPDVYLLDEEGRKKYPNWTVQPLEIFVAD